MGNLSIEEEITAIASLAVRLDYDGGGLRHNWDSEFVKRIAIEVDRLKKQGGSNENDSKP